MDAPVTRHDPHRARKAQRHGKQRGVRIEIAAEELLKAGIDPYGPAPTFKVWPGDGSVFVRFYTS